MGPVCTTANLGEVSDERSKLEPRGPGQAWLFGVIHRPPDVAIWSLTGPNDCGMPL